MGLTISIYKDKECTDEIDFYKPGLETASKIRKVAQQVVINEPDPLIGPDLCDYVFILSDKIGVDYIDILIDKYKTIYIQMDY